MFFKCVPQIPAHESPTRVSNSNAFKKRAPRKCCITQRSVPQKCLQKVKCLIYLPRHFPFENKSCGSAWCKPRRKRNFLGTKLQAATSLHGHIFVKSQRGSGQTSCRTRTQIASIKLQRFSQTPIRRKEIIPIEDQVTEGCTGRGQAEMSLESLTQLDPSHSLPLMFNMFDPKWCLGLI